jgi:uncharacterized OB-fold protein
MFLAFRPQSLERHEMSARPLPFVTHDSEVFWQGCSRGELLVQHCRACGNPQWYPRARCSNCYGYELEWKKSEGKGKIYSFSVVHRGVSQAFDDLIPFVLALVDLEEGIRMMTHVVECDPSAVTIGMPVTVQFREEDGFKLPVFAPVFV